MESSTVLAQVKALLDQGNTEAHALGYTAGRAFEAVAPPETAKATKPKAR